MVSYTFPFLKIKNQKVKTSLMIAFILRCVFFFFFLLPLAVLFIEDYIESKHAYFLELSFNFIRHIIH